ncbi:MAG: PTS sugar transporter subunit IIA [Deltaproteobacteria bacterium]|nr:PTS sugar transporter subunit IIA [Deltaproteobacteria bacterium]
MTITDILTADRVLPDLAATTKDDVLAELASLLVGQIPQSTPDRLVAVLRERERLNSTAIGDGIAIPHGRLPGTKSVVAGFARSRGGVDFDSVDRQPTHLFFVLIAPDDAAAMHLKALARISRLLKDKAFREHLLALRTPQELYDAIVAEDAKF